MPRKKGGGRSTLAGKALSVLCADLIFVAGVVVFSVLLGLAVNSLRSEPMPLFPVPPEVQLVEGLMAKKPSGNRTVSTMTLEEAILVHSEGEAAFVDARDGAFFELGRIPGAWNLSRETFRADLPAFSEQIGKERRLVVYCSDQDCPDSMVVARALRLLGFENVAVFKGGWAEWELAGLPGEKGSVAERREERD